MKKLITSAAMIGVMISQSCTKEKAISETSTSDSLAVVKPPPADSALSATQLPLETFAIPPHVEGCSCYFSDTKENFEDEKYIYVDDYGNSAYIKVEGNMVKIPMKEGDFDPSNFVKNIENSEYRLSMTGKKISEMEEAMMFEGEMTVQDKKTGLKTTSSIYGECGC